MTVPDAGKLVELAQGPPRAYIQRLRNDPRTKAMHDGWVAQACAEADHLYPDPRDDRQRTHHAASQALELAMSFVLDHDGELAMVREQLDRVLEHSLTLASQWQPIETAPRDKFNDVLIYADNLVRPAWYDDESGCWRDSREADHLMSEYHPGLWMPFPDPSPARSRRIDGR